LSVSVHVEQIGGHEKIGEVFYSQWRLQLRLSAFALMVKPA